MARFLFAACVTAGLMCAGAAVAAQSCSAQYGVCFDLCVKYGFGRGRTDHPHPQAPATCRNHCTGWRTACLTSGCWAGDLVQLGGLDRH